MGFVSNSSSSSFLLGVREDIIPEVLAFLERNKENLDEFIKKPKSYEGWDDKIEFTPEVIAEVINEGARGPLSEDGIKSLIEMLKGSIDETREMKFFEEQKRKLENQVKKGLKLYSVLIWNDRIPDRFVEELFIYGLDKTEDDNFCFTYWISEG